MVMGPNVVVVMDAVSVGAMIVVVSSSVSSSVFLLTSASPWGVMPEDS